MMNVVDTTDRTQMKELSFEFDLPHPPEKVWRALSEPALMSEWLLPVTTGEVVAGGEFALQIPQEQEWGATVTCRVLAIEPRRKLEFTWVVGELDTIATFELEPSPTGTRLTLRQSGFKSGQGRFFGGARRGWAQMGERLGDLLTRVV